eukprot:CAMPEP_0184855882 /NCGR_PEP_ID=MMETSP0580-20130426/1037_1 /TAXON_ID=1118495 /ORGANISM="Dactyliosolen fragilissimus" /LENGTH=327 /DNA_ID=CAMNT_0027350557 /DNA_START=138 /DNA_END=1118 /DNA_ORIENTATION=+
MTTIQYAFRPPGEKPIAGWAIFYLVLGVFLGNLYFSSTRITPSNYSSPTAQKVHNRLELFSSSSLTALMNKKPVMHTFYQHAREGQIDTLLLWEELWQNSGFETRILNMTDFNNHPHSKEVSSLLKSKLAKIGKGQNQRDDMYNLLCFYRWFAMATIPDDEDGSGTVQWMSDYDTFPLNIPEDISSLANGNKQFSSYERFVPSLLSGSREEWDRVAHLLLETIDEVPSEFKSDMITLKVLYDRSKSGKSTDTLTLDGIIFHEDGYVRRGLDYISPHVVNCHAIQGHWVVHFSHARADRAFLDGLWPLEGEIDHENRAGAMKIYLREW